MMCIPLTPVLTLLYFAIIEVYLQCFTDSVSLRDIGKPTSRAEIISPSSLYFRAIQGAHIGSALILNTGGVYDNPDTIVLNDVMRLTNETDRAKTRGQPKPQFLPATKCKHPTQKGILKCIVLPQTRADDLQINLGITPTKILISFAT